MSFHDVDGVVVYVGMYSTLNVEVEVEVEEWGGIQCSMLKLHRPWISLIDM